MFGTIGGPELLLIMVIALIVFGPRRLPEIGKSLGRMLVEFRKASTEFRQTVENEIETEKLKDALKDAPRIQPPEVPPTPVAAPAAAALGPEAEAPTPAPVEPK